MEKSKDAIAPVKVSVIVPVFNTERYLRECLDSLVKQTFMDIEIICVDDGSTDGSLRIIKEYALTDPRVRIITQENQFAGVARNNGMKIARGEYLLFLDADDFFDVKLIETTYNQIKKDDADVCLFSFERYDITTGSFAKRTTLRADLLPKLTPFSYRDIPNLIFTVTTGVPWNKLFKKSFIFEHELKFEPRRFSNDVYFCYLALLKAQRITYVNQPLTIHRIGLDDNLQSVKSESPLDFYYASLEIKNELIRMGIYDEVKQGFSNWGIGNSLYYLRTMKSGTAADMVREKLLEEGFAAFDIPGHDESYFYSKHVYNRYLKLTKNLKGTDQKVSSPEDSVLFHKETEPREFINFDKEAETPIKVSVIIPVYNAEDHLRKCLDTVIKQTLLDIEIICVDDGSTDNSLMILKEYAIKDSRVKIIVQDNQYAGVARNNGMKRAQGEYLLFLDADDFFDLTLLKKTYQKIKADNADICLYSFDNYDDRTKQVIKIDHGLKLGLLPDKVPFSYRDIPCHIFNIVIGVPWNKLFRKDFVMHHGLTFEPRRSANDIYFGHLAMVKAERITFVNETLLWYRKGLTHNLQSEKVLNPLDFYYAYHAIKNELVRMGIFDEVKQSFSNVALHSAMQSIKSLTTGDAFAIVYNKMKECGFKEFDIEGHHETYFYNNYIYREFEIVEISTDVEFLHHKLAATQDELLKYSSAAQKDKASVPGKGVKTAGNTVVKKDDQKSTASIYAGFQEALVDAREKLQSFASVNFVNNSRSPAKISIIVPVYNAESYLADTLNSLINQTFPDIEIICVDDHSSDNSRSILEEFAQKDSRVKTIYFDANKTAALARKAGVLTSGGKYIMFVDADDKLDESACGTLLGIMNEVNTDILQFDGHVINCGGLAQSKINDAEKRIRPFNEELRDKDLITECFEQMNFSYTLWGKLYNSDICKIAFLQAEDIPLPKAQDLYAFFLICYYAGSYKGLIDQRLYHYYFGRDAACHETVDLELLERYCSKAPVAGAIKRFLIRRGATDKYQEAFEKIESRLLNECIETWDRLPTSEERSNGINLFLSHWGAVPAISAFVRTKWYKRIAFSKLVYCEDKAFLPHQKKKIKTIGMYYYKFADKCIHEVLTCLIQLWLSMGYRVVLFTDTSAKKDDYSLPQDVEYIEWPDYKLYAGPDYTDRCQAIYTSLQLYEIDVMVYHSHLLPTALWDMLTVKSLGIPFIMHTHNIFSEPLIQNNIYFSEMPYIYRLVDNVLVTSHVDELYWNNFCKKVTFTANPFPFDFENIVPNKLSTKNILWLGYMSEASNPYHTIEIVKRVVEAVPDAILHITEDNQSGNFFEQTRKKVWEYGLEHNVIFHGFNEDAEQLYESASIVLMTSSYAGEGFCLPLLKSKSFGVPCVSYDMPYLEIYRDGRGLLKVAQDDIEEASNAVIALLNDKKLREQLGKDARASAEDMKKIDLKQVWKKVFEQLQCDEISDNNLNPNTIYSSENVKILIDTWNFHSVMGREIQKKKINEQNGLRKRCAELEDELKSIESKTNIDNIDSKLEWNRKQREALGGELKRSEEEIILIRSSWTYRIGRFFTWVPRKLRSLINKKRGLKYEKR